MDVKNCIAFYLDYYFLSSLVTKEFNFFSEDWIGYKNRNEFEEISD